MSDAASVDLLVGFCPGCAANAILDPRREYLEPCPDHRPDLSGTGDMLVPGPSEVLTGGEAGGETNRAFCRLLHHGS